MCLTFGCYSSLLSVYACVSVIIILVEIKFYNNKDEVDPIQCDPIPSHLIRSNPDQIQSDLILSYLIPSHPILSCPVLFGLIPLDLLQSV